MRTEFRNNGLLAKLTNHYTTQVAQSDLLSLARFIARSMRFSMRLDPVSGVFNTFQTSRTGV